MFGADISVDREPTRLLTAGTINHGNLGLFTALTSTAGVYRCVFGHGEGIRQESMIGEDGTRARLKVANFRSITDARSISVCRHNKRIRGTLEMTIAAP